MRGVVHRKSMRLTAISEKFASLGVIVSAMGCASCFPLLGFLGATIGLGFLAQFEGLFINILLPIFAVIALVSVSLSWWSHRQHIRGILGLVGPSMVLATLYLFWTDNWSTYMFYFALALMFAVGVWDIVSPPNKKCAVPIKNNEA
jgi:mercuric ion transport protein